MSKKDRKTQYYFEENQKEVLERQIEQYRHNQTLSEKFIRGIGLTVGLSLTSTVASIVVNWSDFQRALSGFKPPSEVPEGVSPELIEFTRDANLMSSVSILLLSLILFLFTIIKLWNVLNVNTPEPLLGEFGYDPSEFRLDPDEYHTEYKIAIANNSKILATQSEQFEGAYNYAEGVFLTIVIAVPLLIVSFVAPARAVARLDFMFITIFVWVVSLIIASKVVSVIFYSFGGSTQESKLMTEMLNKVQKMLKKLLSPIGPLIGVSLLPVLFSLSLTYLVAVEWWNTVFKSDVSNILPQIPDIVFNNIFTSVFAVGLLVYPLSVAGVVLYKNISISE